MHTNVNDMIFINFKIQLVYTEKQSASVKIVFYSFVRYNCLLAPESFIYLYSQVFKILHKYSFIFPFLILCSNNILFPLLVSMY